MSNQTFKYHFFDFETGGTLIGSEDEFPTVPIQFAAVITDRHLNLVDKYDVFIKFDEETHSWSEEAEGIHGFSREFLEENGVPLEEARQGVIDFLDRNGFGVPNERNPKYLHRANPAGQNVDYDIGILETLLTKKEYDKRFSYHKLDTMPIASFVNDLHAQMGSTAPFKKTLPNGDRIVSSSLDAQRGAFNIPLKGNHDARKDTAHTIACYKGTLLLLSNKIKKGHYSQDFKEKATGIVGPAHKHHLFKEQVMRNPEELFDLVCKFIDDGRVV